MSNIFLNTSPAPILSGAAEDLGAGDLIYVSAGVQLLDEDGTIGVAAIDFGGGAGTADINGTVAGYLPIFVSGTSLSQANISISSTGSVEALLPQYNDAIDIGAGFYEIVNNGQIQGLVVLDYQSSTGYQGSGGGTIDNFGSITAPAQVVINDSTAVGTTSYINNHGVIAITGTENEAGFAINEQGGHTNYLNNSGTISTGGAGVAFTSDSKTVEYFTNSGQVDGAVAIGGATSTFSNSGTINGAVTFAGSKFTDNGTINGVVTLAGSGAGNAEISIAANDSITGGPTSTYALDLQTGSYNVVNSGDVSGLTLDYNYSTFTYTAGGGAVVNHGTLRSLNSATDALRLGDTQTANTDTVANDGSIDGSILAPSSAGVESVGGAGLAVTNTGSIDGYVGVSATRSSSVINSGSIKGNSAAIANGSAAGADDYIYNSGLIAGNVDGIYDGGAHHARIVNAGSISGGAGAGDDAIYASATTQERLVNGGTISGAVSLGASASTIVNSGAIDGDIAFGAGSGRFVNSGSVDGAISFTGTGNRYLGQGGSFTGVLKGAGADGRYYAGAGVESFDLTSAGAALAVGGTGETTFDYGANFTNSMSVQGGSGTTIVDLEGNYITNSVLNNAIFLGARAMVGVSKVVFGAGFSYSLSVNAATVQNGATMTVDASAVGAGLTATLNISKDVGGFYDFIGGAGLDTIVCAAGNLFANDVLVGGANGFNAINFKTAGTVLSAAFANVSGFSIINLVAGANNIQLNDAMVTKANNKTLAVSLSTGADIIDSSQLITATNNVYVNALGASAGDTFIFGAAKETVSLAAGVSTSVNYDTISNFNFGTTSTFDALTVLGYNNPLAIDAAVSGSLSTASFDADLATALAGHLNASDALLFTANAGTLAGDTFLIASTNGSAGYAAGDLVVRLTGNTTGTLATGNI